MLSVRENAYKHYVADSLYYSGQNKRLTKRFSDLLGMNTQPQDTRSGDEIAKDVIEKIGLKFKHGKGE